MQYRYTYTQISDKRNSILETFWCSAPSYSRLVPDPAGSTDGMQQSAGGAKSLSVVGKQGGVQRGKVTKSGQHARVTSGDGETDDNNKVRNKKNGQSRCSYMQDKTAKLQKQNEHWQL